jgi:uncharacterized YigZ family protein
MKHQIREIIDDLRKEYHDARHHCYAWRLGVQKINFRSNDDGEPSGTAGLPILGQIKKHELTDILIVVIRYFGGILLGSGGLINAYRSAAGEAIENSEIIKRSVTDLFEIKFTFSVMNEVMKVLKDEGARPLERVFDTNCSLTVRLPRSRLENIAGRLSRIESVLIEKLSRNY